jgi:hypothetical protein
MSSKRLALSCGLFTLCSLVYSASAQQQEWVATNQISFSDAYLCEHRLLVMPTSVPTSGDATIRKINLSVHNGSRELRTAISTNEANDINQYATIQTGTPRPAYGELFVRERSIPGLAPGSSPGFEVGYRWATETRIVTPKPNYVFGLEKKCPTNGTNGTGGVGAAVIGGAELTGDYSSGYELKGSFNVPSTWDNGAGRRVVILSPTEGWGVSAGPGETVGGVSVPMDSGKPVTVSKQVQCSYFGPLRCQPRTLMVAFLRKEFRSPGIEEDVVLASGVFEARPALMPMPGGVNGSGRFSLLHPSRARAEVAFSFDYGLPGVDQLAQLFIAAYPGPIAVQCHLSKTLNSSVITSTCSGSAGATFAVQDGSGTLVFEYDCDSMPGSSRSCDITPEVSITLQPGYPEFKPLSTKIRLERAQ